MALAANEVKLKLTIEDATFIVLALKDCATAARYNADVDCEVLHRNISLADTIEKTIARSLKHRS